MAAPARRPRDLPLGTLLVEEGLLRVPQLKQALAAAQESGRRLGEVLVARGLVDERTLARLVAEQEELDFIDLGKHDLDPQAVALLSEEIAREHEAVAFGFDERAVRVAVADPVDGAGLDALRAALARPVHFIVATKSEVEAALAEAYGDPAP
jgi:hypothetical protein